ncbi:HIT family protein [Actinopolymorpha pittospori]|uniref:Histidine triad (HIT) family protein n=1 Tax=Actinopolymorpha pittospori TaxID=648752 RepID=A0A927MVX3_9ACTN|nr:HIT family protein [Actinopolymorpha pittospori]MBE1604287.1 histidine triad (HIT) family protein [Actinopolymorpha pittospori]
MAGEGGSERIVQAGDALTGTHMISGVIRSHEPEGYDCPICRLMHGENTSLTTPDNIVHRDEHSAVIVSPHWWVGNIGNLLVVPVAHVENLYHLPDELGGPLLAMSRRAANALLEVLGCDGISLRQHNGPAGGQDMWHLHIHVVPRWSGDSFHRGEHTMRAVDLAEQHEHAARLRSAGNWSA